MKENGRSMVEMLGVLAIIGVLSAGAMAGYSKAMFQHRLNMQREQISLIMNAIITKLPQLKDIPSGSEITSYFIQMGDIPWAMVKNNVVTDSFHSTYHIFRTTTGQDDAIHFRIATNLLKSDDGQALAICENIVATIKNYSQEIYVLENYSHDSEGNRNSSLMGDRYCTTNCISKLTGDKLHKHCSFAKGADGSFSAHQIYFLLNR